jgi:hypothetical protein
MAGGHAAPHSGVWFLKHAWMLRIVDRQDARKGEGFGHEPPRTHPSEERDDFAHYGIVPLRSGMVA